MQYSGKILIFFCVFGNIASGDSSCDCHDIPTCRCEKYACHCKESLELPCVCKLPSKEQFDNCMKDCQPSCLGSCLAFNPVTTCETTCKSACSITCPSRIKTKLLKTSLTEFCLNDCLADCLLSSNFKKLALLDGKAKHQCQDLCQSSCEKTIIPAVDEVPNDGIIFATDNTNLKEATFSKYGCTQKCHAECNDKCVTSGAPNEVCVPTCDAFCSQKCDIPGSRLPTAMCVSACRPGCEKSCVLDKTLEVVFGFVEKTKNINFKNFDQLMQKEKLYLQPFKFHQIPPIAQVIPVPTETRFLQNQKIQQPHQTVPIPVNPEIKLPSTSVNCRLACLPSCVAQCGALQRPHLNCSRLCDRTCELNCSPGFPTTFGSYPSSQSEIQTKCREQLSLKCGALCQSSECAEICSNAVRFLCTRSAECNGICQKSCSQHCLINDKAFAQCGPSCAESCQRECRLSDAIRNECQTNCLGTCGRKCETTSPTPPLKYQCTTNCPQLCHSVCFE